MAATCPLPPGGNRAALTSFRFLRAVGRTALDVAATTGPAEVARQVAFLLLAADRSMRQAVLCLLASLHAKGWPGLPLVAEVAAAVKEFERAVVPCRITLRRRSRPQAPASVPLPVERARAVPVETVLARYGVDLRPAGRRLVGRCPFHDDRRPSLSVDVRRGLWYCFPCGIGGDGISFVERLKGLTFAEAVREVAA